jgi:hypothetical protein
VGSLRGPDILLTVAFTEQYQSIGWYNFLLDRISAKWGKAVALYNKSTDPSYHKAWTTQTILLVWKFSRSLWTYRNTVVHGASDQEVAANSIFRTTSHFLLPRHRYLFKCRTLEQRLRLDFDSLSCWIRSVEDAKQALIHHENQQHLYSSRFLLPFLKLVANVSQLIRMPPPILPTLLSLLLQMTQLSHLSHPPHYQLHPSVILQFPLPRLTPRATLVRLYLLALTPPPPPPSLVGDLVRIVFCIL